MGVGAAVLLFRGEQVVKEEALFSMEIPSWWELAPPVARFQGLPSFPEVLELIPSSLFNTQQTFMGTYYMPSTMLCAGSSEGNLGPWSSRKIHTEGTLLTAPTPHFVTSAITL